MNGTKLILVDKKDGCKGCVYERAGGCRERDHLCVDKESNFYIFVEDTDEDNQEAGSQEAP